MSLLVNLSVLRRNSWPTGPGSRLVAQGALQDFGQDRGAYRIADVVVIQGAPDIPVSRRVLLHDQLSGRVLRSTWSDPVTGAYSFERIRMGRFYVVAFDHTGDKRAVIADNLTPELMP